MIMLLRKVSSFTLGLCIAVYGGYTFVSRVFDFEAAAARAFQDLQQATLQQQRMINELIQRNTELSNQLFRRGSLEEEVEAVAGQVTEAPSSDCSPTSELPVSTSPSSGLLEDPFLLLK
ncbi:hypothetical protein N7465_006933 [Penicillium sp. CMV-2018d]|nr:hypothetical protein N7465_006933 [Penicillium sp. CMV-2018d]